LNRAPLFPSAAVLWNLALGTWNFPHQRASPFIALAGLAADAKILLENQDFNLKPPP